MKDQLLPEGFRDSLPDLAELEYRTNDTFLKIMKNSGFSYVKPPIVEFETSLFSLGQEKQKNESFRILDPLSQKVMAIRSDITSQIVRIANGSLISSKRPLRLCYSGEILKVKNNNLNMSRQSIQIGAEIIGVKKDIIFTEIINLIINLLHKLKFKNFILNFSMPGLIFSIKDDFNLNEKEEALLINSYKNKNIEELKNISVNLYDISKFLLSCIGNIDPNLEALKKYNFSKQVKNQIDSFTNSILVIKNEFTNNKFFIDPLEVDEIDYHDNISFKVYSNSYKELLNGGFYSVNGEMCVGFSGLLENLLS